MDQSSSPEANGPNHAPRIGVFHVHQFSNATENELDNPPQSMIPGTLDAPHHPVAFDPMKSLEHFSFTPHSDYLGELHPDGTNRPFSYSNGPHSPMHQHWEHHYISSIQNALLNRGGAVVKLLNSSPVTASGSLFKF
ncbi:MAG: hypothetical protein LQ345_001943 [Seirophora villosa]|nr:MAG: hypothetical protein LQ345_001943 [Seirophora villosa]